MKSQEGQIGLRSSVFCHACIYVIYLPCLSSGFGSWFCGIYGVELPDASFKEGGVGES